MNPVFYPIGLYGPCIIVQLVDELLCLLRGVRSSQFFVSLIDVIQIQKEAGNQWAIRCPLKMDQAISFQPFCCCIVDISRCCGFNVVFGQFFFIDPQHDTPP